MSTRQQGSSLSEVFKEPETQKKQVSVTSSVFDIETHRALYIFLFLYILGFQLYGFDTGLTVPDRGIFRSAIICKSAFIGLITTAQGNYCFYICFIVPMNTKVNSEFVSQDLFDRGVLNQYSFVVITIITLVIMKEDSQTRFPSLYILVFKLNKVIANKVLCTKRPRKKM